MSYTLNLHHKFWTSACFYPIHSQACLLEFDLGCFLLTLKSLTLVPSWWNFHQPCTICLRSLTICVSSLPLPFAFWPQLHTVPFVFIRSYLHHCDKQYSISVGIIFGISSENPTHRPVFHLGDDRIYGWSCRWQLPLDEMGTIIALPDFHSHMTLWWEFAYSAPLNLTIVIILRAEDWDSDCLDWTVPTPTRNIILGWAYWFHSTWDVLEN